VAIKKTYGSSLGPYVYDDTDLINDPDGDFAGQYQHALITEGKIWASRIFCATAPSDPYEVVRLADLSPSTMDGDILDIDWNPSNYTPTVAAGYSADVDDLTSHLKGIDNMLGVLENDISTNETDIAANDYAVVQLGLWRASGWDGTFTNADGDTVTVVDGLITDVS